MKKILHKGIILVILTLLVISAIVFAVKAEFSINLSPLSGEPGDTIGVSSLTGDFEPLTSVGIGFGEEVTVTDESVTIADTGSGTVPRTVSGFTANRPIKPGSFNLLLNQGGQLIEFFDNGDGTLGAYTGMSFTAIINYTSGFFSRTSTGTVEWFIMPGSKVNYTTYELDVTPEDAATTASGYLIETVTVPSVANGNYVITAIDELGNVGVGTLQVIPEPLTVGAIVLLSSIAVMVSFYWLRKRPSTKNNI